jgi:GNAT superfamily N-acetyltransferase
MISIEEIPVEKAGEFWALHSRYLTDDIHISDEEKAYFGGNEYRCVLQDHMVRAQDRHHMIYFVKNGNRIGAAQYTTYQSEDGKCFILDFWVFPDYRGSGTGHECFQVLRAHTAKDGAKYYALNTEGERRIHFWSSLGFDLGGIDESGACLFIRKDS